jgi:hypothetical protein
MIQATDPEIANNAFGVAIGSRRTPDGDVP